MRIGINALYLLPGKVGGTEIYIRNLVRELSRIAAGDELFVFINKESIGVFEKAAPGVKVVPCPIRAERRPIRILWEQLVLPFTLKRLRIDVLLSAGMTAPFICPAPSVVVIYDLQHVNMPENFARHYLVFLKSIIYLSAMRADAVITISGHVKEDIVRHYRIAPSMIHVTHLAADGNYFHLYDKLEVGAVRERYGLPDRFILYIASSLPHKNYERLLQAFKAVKEEDKEIKLVLIGARDYGQGVIAGKIKELGLDGDVKFLGWLPFEDIPRIYAASDLFVFPSLHEGFGIPVLEAMACGVPVVCSAIEPLKEVAGDAAFFIDPLDVRDLARGMLSVLGDRALRERLIEEGLRRSSGFAWEKTARDTLSVLNTFSKS